MSILRYVPIIISLVLLQAGCGLASPEEQRARHKERGTAYYDTGKFNEALIEFANAIKLAPKDADSHYRLAQTYVQLGGQDNLVSAFSELTKTVEIQPTHRQAQLLLGALYLLGNEPDKALERADFVLKTDPADADGLVLRANSLVRKMDFQRGIAAYETALAKDRNNPSLYVGLAQAYVAAQNVAGAEQALHRALTTIPQSPELWLALGDLHQLHGTPEKAEDAFIQGLKAAPGHETLSLKLAQFYLHHHKLPQAEAIYENLAVRNPDQEQYYLLLGDFYFSIGNRDKALDSFVEATQTSKSSSLSRDKLIGYHMDIGNLAQAETLIKAALERDKKDFMARLLDARLRVMQGKGEDTTAQLRMLVKEQPNSPMAHEFLGIALSQTQSLHEAQVELTEAQRLAPQAVGPRMELAKVHLAQRSYDLAIEQAEAALRINPRNFSPLFLLGEAYWKKGDASKAQTAFGSIAKIAPDYPKLQHYLGLIARAQHRNSEAVTHFENELKKDPQAFNSLAEIMAVKMQEGKASEVENRLARQIELVPNSPTLYHLLGQFFILTRENTKAIEALKTTIELDPNFFPVYLTLGTLYHQSGKTQDAEREYTTAIEKNPSFVQAHMMLGMIEESRRNYDKARMHYEHALAANSKFAPAANNLAWLLIDQGGNSDVALGYAQTAREVRPEDPTIADTLGWIYYKKNVPLKAVNILKEAASKLPDNPVIQYHYGMALALKGENELARKSLSQALKLNPSFAGSQEARAKLKDLEQKPSR